METGDDVSAAILKLLKFSPRGMSITDIAKKLKRDRNAVARQLDVLKAEGKVDTRQIGTARVYWLSQRVPLSAFLCFTQNMILILDRNMNIVQANDKYTGLTGYTKDELIGRNLRALRLPIVSDPDVFGIIESTDKEQVITDVRSRVGNDELFFKMEVIPTSFEAGETGLTIVLEDITEKKRHLKNMEFLARTAMELVDLPPEADIFWYIAERVAELMPGRARCWVESYDEVQKEFKLNAIVDEKFRRDTVQLNDGRDFVGLTLPIQDFCTAPFPETPSSMKEMREYRFRPFFDDEKISFYDICMHQFPGELCEKFLLECNLAKAYLTGLVWQEQLFGVVGIFLRPDEELGNRQAIESFLRQASIAIARRMTEERLSRSEQRFFDLVSLSDKPALVMNQEGKTTLVNPGFSDEFGFTQVDIPHREAWLKMAFPDPEYRKKAVALLDSDHNPSNESFTMQCRDGKKKDVCFQPVRLSDGTVVVVCDPVDAGRWGRPESPYSIHPDR
jgi:PAS domain S-box-containing protein